MAAEQDPEGRAAARPLLTDLYQATMALGYWRAGRARDAAEFELFFRRCPFGGAFALAAGLRDCVRFLRAFRLRDAGSPPACATNPPPREPPTPDEPLTPDGSSHPGSSPPRPTETPTPRSPPRPTDAPTHGRCKSLPRNGTPMSHDWSVPTLVSAQLPRFQTCSSWPRCCPQTQTLRSSSTFGPSTAPR